MNAFTNTPGLKSVPAPIPTYRPAIDGLRAVAILAVILYHLNHRWLPGGFVGVDVFFVISGYLITSILLDENSITLKGLSRFYQRRIARLLPALTAMAIATLIGSYLFYSDQDLASAGINMSFAAASLANFKLMIQGNYFTLSPDAQPFLHCWSLSVEEQFYLVFPTILLLLMLVRSRQFMRRSLAVLLIASLVFCVIQTHSKPEFAFFLLPTRAWELLAGSLLYTYKSELQRILAGVYWLPALGVSLILVALIAITDTMAFPGYLAILPVAGSALILLPASAPTALTERLLGWGPMPLIGRMSYSLYLWHWPVFSIVDYRLYAAPSSTRLLLKILIGCGTAILCYLFIERPGRRYFNALENQRRAFAFLGLSIAVMVPLGVHVRTEHYINASLSEVRNGGIIINSGGKGGSIVLMGDSNASMYGKLAKQIASERDMRLTVISVASGDPMPRTVGADPELWSDSLAVIAKEHPDFLIYVCDWRSKLGPDGSRLGKALNQLAPLVREIIFVTQPPQPPVSATREAVRNGSKPPYLEDSTGHSARDAANSLIRGLSGEHIHVVDIESVFGGKGGGIRLTDQDGHELYQDGGHLSAAGAMLAKPLIMNAIGHK